MYVNNQGNGAYHGAGYYVKTADESIKVHYIVTQSQVFQELQEFYSQVLKHSGLNFTLSAILASFTIKVTVTQ